MKVVLAIIYTSAQSHHTTSVRPAVCRFPVNNGVVQKKRRNGVGIRAGAGSARVEEFIPNRSAQYTFSIFFIVLFLITLFFNFTLKQSKETQFLRYIRIYKSVGSREEELYPCRSKGLQRQAKGN